MALNQQQKAKLININNKRKAAQHVVRTRALKSTENEDMNEELNTISNSSSYLNTTTIKKKYHLSTDQTVNIVPDKTKITAEKYKILRNKNNVNKVNTSKEAIMQRNKLVITTEKVEAKQAVSKIRAKQYAIKKLSGEEDSLKNVGKDIVITKTKNIVERLFAKVAKKLVLMIASMITSIFGIALFPIIAVVLIVVVLMQVPPLSLLASDQIESKSIVITYADKMTEFGIELNDEIDNNTIVEYNYNLKELRENVIKIYLAKKGFVGAFTEMSETDYEEIGNIAKEMLSYNSNVTWRTIQDGDLINSQGYQIGVSTEQMIYDDFYLTSKKYNVDDINMPSTQLLNSCNKYGCYYDYQANTKLDVYNSIYDTVHNSTYLIYPQKWKFIPCCVDLYSSIPIGTYLEIENYVYEVVGKIDMQIYPEYSNNTIALCGYMDDYYGEYGNIVTDIYGKIHYDYAADGPKDVKYINILAHQNDEDAIEVYYRDPDSLLKEFKSLKSSDLNYAMQELLLKMTDEEIENAGWRTAVKTLTIYNYDLDTYTNMYLNEKEKTSLAEINDIIIENNDMFIQYVKDIFSTGTSEIIQSEIPKYINCGNTYTDVSLVKEIYQAAGIMLPNTATKIAEYIDTYKLTTTIDELEVGDLIFLKGNDTNAYKQIGEIVMYAGENEYYYIKTNVLKTNKIKNPDVVMCAKL